MKSHPPSSSKTAIRFRIALSSKLTGVRGSIRRRGVLLVRRFDGIGGAIAHSKFRRERRLDGMRLSFPIGAVGAVECKIGGTCNSTVAVTVFFKSLSFSEPRSAFLVSLSLVFRVRPPAVKVCFAGLFLPSSGRRSNCETVMPGRSCDGCWRSVCLGIGASTTSEHVLPLWKVSASDEYLLCSESFVDACVLNWHAFDVVMGIDVVPCDVLDDEARADI